MLWPSVRLKKIEQFMDSLDLARQLNSREMADQIFIFEVVIPPRRGSRYTYSYRQSRKFWRVPYRQLNAVIKQINRLGGKIKSVSVQSFESDKESISDQNSHYPWWVEISTRQPSCLYYFGPFESSHEAQSYQPGYVEDLQMEGATGISVMIKQCQPQILTQEWDT